MPADPTCPIWTNATLSETALTALASRAGQHPILIAASGKTSNLVPGAADPQLAAAGIAFGQPDPQQVIESTNLMWVHLTSAGYTRYDTDAVRTALGNRGAVLTNSSSVYNDPCAQHILAMMLAGARQLPIAFAEQQTHHGWHSHAVRAGCYLLTGQSAIIYGYGAIGHRLVELLQPFNMRLTAVRRNVRGSENIPTLTPDGADALLPHIDHVINILPQSPTTERFFDADRLAKLNPSAIFYNIGRGTTVDTIALRDALEHGKMKAAFLDVTDPEPLPPDHPLWETPNCHITPHSGGGHATEFDRLTGHFIENLARYNRGEPLRDRVI